MLIKPLQYRLAMVHKLLFHPFVHPDFPESLKKRKYSLQELPRISPPGPRAYVDGHIARKNGCLIETNNQRSLVAVDGLNDKNFVGVMKDLISISQEDFGVNLDSDLDYMELTANCIVTTDKKPTDAFRKFRSDIFNKISEVLNSETTLFGIRFAPENLLPSSRNWFDIQIQPRLTKPDKEYYVTVIYRSEEMGKVMDFSQNINDKIASIISVIEGG